jgi:acetyltransferase-like isoleucine patch superfamily enzyme
MPFLPLRKVPLPSATTQLYSEWLAGIAERLDRPGCDRNELCRQILTELYYPHMAGRSPESLGAGPRVALAQLDPRNITLESEYYADIDPERFAPVKPLLWLWEMFDKSPAGENIALGVKLRRILARHIFKRCGANFKCFQFVKFSFGYNIEAGDNVVIHRYVLLDDRGGIVLGDRASVADYGNVYSHTHDLGDQRIVTSPVTTLGDGARVTYHATVLAGADLEPDSMLGALAVATRNVPSGQVALGIPALPRLNKPPMAQRRVYPASVDPLADE